ncbi:hypothetical protein BN7_4189 [Wickerhamomyces ciferrii]|uniref:assimilatory sulfite reductase (NADPH) n=1 Tax=Wickerhamomyces ciferrii (strain ATCC 14091 / BCRC 22168 / CBS 111 / JCM 3599 / NBRC 0793 / NRRL Y-1031 F-60-10) TaxID=1206466 RepID=K0KHC7_WICCF|nr:uncharacterized protein BN7_4189 [Wickerhamomyces ciferrii]CCH44620.1 hypothetical protein BN7_4189 [Wickerhamomyces ciferrii]
MSIATVYQKLDTAVIFNTLETKASTPIVRSHHDLLNSSDPFQQIIQIQEQIGELISAIFTNDSTLLQALPHLDHIKPNTVINIALSNYQTIIALKDLNFTTLVSNSNQDIINHSVLAHLLVQNNIGKPVLHFINYELATGSIKFNADAFDKLLSLDLTQDEDLFQSALNHANKHGFKINHIDYHAGSKSAKTAIVSLGSHFHDLTKNSSNLPIIDIKIFKPFPIDQILSSLPSSIDSIAILENSIKKPFTRFSPLLLEFFQSPSALIEKNILKITSASIGDYDDDFNKLINIILSNLSIDNPIQNLFFGNEVENFNNLSQSKLDEISKINKLESSYITILDQIFGSNLQIFNQFQKENINLSSPEFGFGSFIYQSEQQQKLTNLIHNSLDSPELKFNTPKVNELVEKLSKWLVFKRDGSLSQDQLQKFNSLSLEILDILHKDDSETSKKLLEFKSSFLNKSSWLIGSDSWAYDLGNSGVHHVLASNENINVLIIDNETFEEKKSNQLKSSTLRKKDIGLYAMNYTNAYVGSIAIYSSYTQMLTTLIEATQFDGPSIILAYLPIQNEFDTPLEILTNTKKSVDSGFIPLYRYNPKLLKDSEIFKLDSTVIKENLKEFLDRENKLTLLSKKSPQFARDLKQSQTSIIKQKQDKKAQQAYDQLLEGLSGPPISIYFASDGGSAENLAKKLGKRASQRGLKATVLSMDDIILEDLPSEETILFITSTSGQGEFPQNGKNFWDSIRNSGDLDLEFSSISCFGLGDSLYWPRAQDKHYYNKPAKDLHERLKFLNAKELIPLGLGDDQDADGFQTGYKEWESNLWKALGVDNITTADEPPPITNEDIKIASDFLRGGIAEGLKDESTGAISAHDQQLTKFHGIYMQDDRDLRDARKAAGLEPFYIFMARVRLPGGITTPDQWLVLDKLADERGNGTVKLTTRATYQLHGIVKHNLKPSIRAMNSVLMDTLGACGDVNRNVMISALPHNAKIHSEVDNIAKKISQHLLPQTTAYHEIWLKGDDPEDDDPNWPEIFEKRKDGPKKIKTLVAGNALVDNEPFYGPTYLPRKYKINITVPPYNDVDVWSSDVGLIAIVENNEVIGFNVLVGGGMGSTHNNKKTYPRAGSSFGFAPIDQIHLVCEKVMLVQKEHGNRKDRKNARLKYTVDTLGVDVYKSKVEELWGQKFEPERAYEIKDNVDHFGWVTDELSRHHFTCFIENGRVEDTPELPQKTGLKKIAEFFKSNPNSKGTFRLTGNQHVLISTVSNEELPTVKQILHDYKLDNTDFSGLRLSSAACVAFPTCGLAMAESERYLPVLVGKIEEALEEYGLRHDSVVMRMTGCPNGCARPWLAEIALVGKAYGTYNLMLGGGYYGQRVNKIYKQSIKEDEVLAILKPLFKRWALEREEGEHFGDFCIRTGVIAPTLEGKYFHDDVPEWD